MNPPAKRPSGPISHPAVGAARAAVLLWLAVLFFSTAAAEIALGLVLLATVVAFLRGELRGQAPLPPAARLALAGWAILVVLLLIAHLSAVDGQEALRKLPKLYRYGLVFALAFLPPSPAFLRRVLWMCAALAIVLAALSLPPLLRGAVDRAQTAHLHYNTLTQIAASISLLLAAAALFLPGVGRPVRVAWSVGALVATLVMVATLSRAAWAAWLPAMLLLVLLSRRQAWLWLLVGAVLAGAVATPGVRDRLAAYADLSDPEFTRRYDMWAMGWNIVQDHPWTGIGPGSMDELYDRYRTGVLIDDPQRWPHMHGDLVTTAVYYGVPATAFWAALAALTYIWLMAMLLRRRRGERWAVFLGAGLSLHVFYVCGLLHDTLPIYQKAHWLLLMWGLMLQTSRTAAVAPVAPGGWDLEARA